MSEDHPPVGLLISALGAAVLAISVFLPWWGVSFTSTGVAVAQEHIAEIAQQYGNTNFQLLVHKHDGELDALAGRQIATVSAHRILTNGNLILLVLAGFALLASFVRLADIRELLPVTSGGLIALAGGLAFAYVFLRMLWAPSDELGLLSLSPSYGIFVAMLSAATVCGGGLAAGSGPTRRRRIQKNAPGPPPVRSDVASPLTIFQDRP